MKTMQEADYFFQKYKLNAASQLEEKLKKEREKFEAAKGAEKEKEPEKRRTRQVVKGLPSLCPNALVRAASALKVFPDRCLK